MTNYRTSNGDWYDPVSPLEPRDMSSKAHIRFRTRLLVHSLVTLPPESEEALVKIAYSIGIAEPVMAMASIKHKAVWSEGNLSSNYDLRPQAIIERLNLKKPIYEETAKWGAFGHTDKPNFTWEK